MATAPSITTLFSDIASPEAVRAKEAEARQTQGEMLAKNPSMNYGTMMLPERASRVSKNLGGMLGVETRSEAEIMAEANKKLFNELMQQAQAKYPKSQADQLSFVAAQLTAKGKMKEAEKARNAAQQARLQEAKISTELAQGTKYTSEAARADAQAAQAIEETTTEKLQRPYTLANELASIEKSQAQATEALAGADLKREQVAESKKNKELIEAKIKDEGMTDFLREANAVNLTPEDREALIRQRVEVRAKTGGSQYDPNAISTKAIYDRGYEAVDVGMQAIQGYEVADMALSLLPDADVGNFKSVKEMGTWVGANILGLDGAMKSKFSNEFVDVLINDLALQKTTMLKGVLSESDMKLIRDSVGSRGNTRAAVQAAFANLAATKYADVKMANVYDDLLLQSDKMLKIPHGQVKEAIKQIAKTEYLIKQYQQKLISEDMLPSKAQLKLAEKAKTLLAKYDVSYSAGIM